MKTALAILLAVSLLTGCATTNQQNGQTVDHIGNMLETAFTIGAIKHLTDNEDDRPKLEKALAALDGLTNAPTAEAFDLLLTQLALSDLGDKDTKLAIFGALTLYRLELRHLVPEQQPPFVSAAATRIRAGIALALATVPKQSKVEQREQRVAELEAR